MMNFIADGNLALNRTAWQISTGNYNGYTNYASLSVDGNKDSDFNHGSCSHTGQEVNPWWVVDIGYQRTRITGVNLTNRGDEYWS